MNCLIPKNDYVFKRIFESEENTVVLLAFLNHTFKNAGESLLTDDIEIHFMEIPKLKDNNIRMDDGLVRWLLFLKGIPSLTGRR
ncbi:PD-(D/E)XK nuclease family transposase [Paenibacillus sp. NPDC056933]|uniref:PD-(D/E)XK nuclease family transposase n=1 Tax=Paenibacillus sp. NPDC056933 TaxID=3345968 RepID=UPI00362F5DD9